MAGVAELWYNSSEVQMSEIIPLNSENNPALNGIDQTSPQYEFSTGVSIGRIYSTGSNGTEARRLYQLRILAKAGPEYDPKSDELDPITNQSYSVDDDASLFKVLPLCDCNKECQLPDLIPLPISFPPPINQNCEVIGFSGPILNITIPLKVLNESDLNLCRNKIKPGILTKSSGRVLRDGSLYAITNATTGGFPALPL